MRHSCVLRQRSPESFLYTWMKISIFPDKFKNPKVNLPRLIITHAGIPLLGLPCAAAAPVDFTRDVQPLLNNHCAECHGGVKQKGGLRLTNRRQALEGGKSGEALLVSGHPKASELFKRITHLDPDEQMPPKKRLKAAEIEIFRAWIERGAAWPEHWAYRTLEAIDPPTPTNSDWPRNEIDRFVLDRLRRASLTPSLQAPPHVLLRRLHLDLIGLPPTLAELSAFETAWQEDQEACLEATVDRLLASPHFGERWGRHWLDQARYADSDGYEKDNARPNAGVWRDWVIEAINADLPFDQFTIEQLAGDLLPDATPHQRLATAFHRQTLWNREGGVDAEEDRTKRVIDRVSTTTKTWLGLTLQCAQCHDHPYDPITQRDFYQVYAFFNNADEAGAKIPLGDGQQAVDVMKRNGKRKTYLFERGDFLQPDKAGGEVQANGIAFLHRLEAKEPTRLDLAHWLTSPANPLMARVTVNTVWTHLFGTGLSNTPENFGSEGNAPSHPALLAWLAHDFMTNGWSRKRLVKTIVLSHTYLQSSNHRPELVERDPDNRLLHRQNRKRVEAEIIRDLHLSVAGQIAHRIGGKSVFPPIPPDVAAQSYANSFKWKESSGPDRYRRGMYTFFKRTAPEPTLMTFDCPDSNISVTQRNVSNTPLMALTTLQNVVFHEAAQAFARHLLADATLGTDRERLNQAYRICLARKPSAEEQVILDQLLRDNQATYAKHPEEARKLAGKGAVESKAPTIAAWVATLRIITNLDEFVTSP